MQSGKTVTLPLCHVTSHPPARITWAKVHDKLPHGRIAAKNGQLSILNTRKTDSGLYQCTATNKLGVDSTGTQLVVMESPSFTVTPPSKLAVSPNQNISVSCQATGDPRPKISWTKENGQLPSGRSEAAVDGTLQIWNVKEEDSGRYTCAAFSMEVFKSLTTSMQLTVKDTKGSS